MPASRDLFLECQSLPLHPPNLFHVNVQRKPPRSIREGEFRIIFCASSELKSPALLAAFFHREERESLSSRFFILELP